MTTETDTFIQEIQALVTGVQKHVPNVVLTLASQTFTGVQLVQALQALVTSASSVNTPKTAWHNAVQGNQSLVKQNASFVSELRQTVALMFGDNETTLADFGLAPKKVRKPLTTEALAARAAKARATRAARGTTSKKKKAAVTGNVTGVSIVPITTTAAPTTTAASSAATVSVVSPPVTATSILVATPQATPAASAVVAPAPTTGAAHS